MRALIVVAALLVLGATPAHRRFTAPNCRSVAAGSASCSFVTNILRQSETFDSATWQMASGTITKGAADSVVAPDSTTTADKIVISGSPVSDSNIFQTVAGVASTQYTFSVYLWVEAGTQTVRLSRNNGAAWAGATVSPTLTLNTTPTLYSLTYTTGAAETTSNVSIGGEGLTPFIPGSGTFVAWDGQVELGAVATARIRTTTASVGISRCPSLEVCVSGTNSVLRSEEYSNATWTKTAGTVVTADQAVAPDGTTTMDLVTTNDASFLGATYQPVTFGVAQTRVTHSTYVRAVSGTAPISIGVACAGAITSVDTCLRSDGLSCTKGSSGTSAFAYGTFGTVPVRFSITVTCTSSTVFYPLVAGGQQTVSNGSAYFWGSKFEPGATASTYIKTVGSTAINSCI